MLAHKIDIVVLLPHGYKHMQEYQTPLRYDLRVYLQHKVRHFVV